MVKGVSRRVIVVASPDRRYFDEAIFILRSDAPGGEQSAAVAEARRIARRAAPQRRCFPLPRSAPLWTLLGAAPVALLWLLTGVL